MLENKKNNNIKAGLYVVATPIGNLEDITFRALNVLRNSDYILCEDTRHSLKILNHYKIKAKLIAFHQHNENKNLEKIFNDIKEGKIISLISDAGTPLISDPGEIIVKQAREAELNVIPIPGPSATIASVSVAGFDTKFYFYGFLSKKNNIRKTEFEKLSQLSCTIVLYVPARDLKKTLKDIAVHLPLREILIAREITKIHETYYRGFPEDLIREMDEQSTKGEITIVISDKSVDLEKIFNDIKEGKIISLISDAGTPLISDPGEIIVKKARQAELNVIPVPGPSATIASVSVAGFDTKFYFYGFLSKKNNIRKTEFEKLSQLSCTIVLYVPARDLKKTLKDIAAHLPLREILIAREITKIHETYYRGFPEDLIREMDEQSTKGEITIVISDKSVDLKKNSNEINNLEKEIKLLINKMSSKDIAEYLSDKMNISKKIVYQNILKLNL